MELTTHEFWGLIHGLILGGGFLLAFGGGLAEFYSLRPERVTVAEITARARRLVIGTTAMATIAWVTVITGSWIVYPWYREEDPDSPKSLLLSDPDTSDWHEFAMEWKEHIAWIAPMLATAVAVIAIYYRGGLVRNHGARRIAEGLFVAAFATAAIAGILGALITKKAPIT